ncbi:MAG TPA: PEP-CTERM sorting domain-containing protein [Terriglobales bacterium]|nr:PEP-CTERM sorting domain-containing protein [Terriglobales bacterium]
MRRVVVIALLALALPMAVWADNITLTNQGGTISISASGITSKGSQLKSFNGIQAPPGKSLGSVSYSTGALLSGSIAAGGVFSSAGSTFDVIGKGNYGQPKGPIFTGGFTGNIDWTLVSSSGQKLVYTLSGDLSGQLYNGVMVTGQTTQTITTHPGQLAKGIGHITVGTTELTTPEPGTLGLLGTGLLGIAGMFRRKRS